MVGGLVDQGEIFDTFVQYFSEASRPNSIDKNNKMQTEFDLKFNKNVGDFLQINDFVSVELVSMMVSELKCGKAFYVWGFLCMLTILFLFSHFSLICKR